MERRDSTRIRRRIACEFDYDGHTHTAIVVDLSVGGLFLQTDTAITPGTELTLRLRGDAFGEMELRGYVVRRRFTPTVIATMIRRGVGVRLVSAPPAYYEAIGTTVGSEEPVWSALEDLEPPFEPSEEEGAVTIDVVLTATPPPAAPQEKPDERIEGVEEVWDALAPIAPALEPSWAPTARHRADALLIHDAELADVQALLEGMGADVRSQRAVDPSDFEGWERPPRLIVASGRNALRLAMGANVEAQGTVPIAVVDSGSHTLCGMLRRQGFRYVVRRPVHPEALRLLLGRALFRGRERRDAARVSLGCEIGLRFQLRRKAATLLELSRTGCRVLGEDWVEPGDHLSLRVPSEITGNRPLTLPGRVVRSERQRRGGADSRVAVALRFDRLGDVARARLEALIAAHTLGPARLPWRGVSPAAGEARSTGAAPSAAATLAAPAPATAAGAPLAQGREADRRGGRRSLHRREVVALESDLSRVRHALLGIDLSSGGVRVEPHPELALGDRVRIAIYDSAAVAAIVLQGEVERDDGARGVVLRFIDVSDEEAREIARVLEGKPQIEAPGGEAGRAVRVGELLER